MRQGPNVAALERLLPVLAETAAAITAGQVTAQACRSAARLLELGPDDAAEHVRVLQDQHRGLIGDGRVDAKAFGTLVSLRRRFLPVAELSSVTARLDDLVRTAVLVD